jgi:hypothetical protein
MRLLVLGLATLVFSASAASAQQAVYPRYGYAPHGYGYAHGYGHYGYHRHYYHHRYYAYYLRYHGHRGWYRY